MALQLDIFKSQEECEIDSLRRSLEEVRRSGDKVRRGTYARLNELTRDYIDLKVRLEIMERNICKAS